MWKKDKKALARKKKAKEKLEKRKKKEAAKKKEKEKEEASHRATFLKFLRFCESKLSVVLGRNEKDLKNKKLSDRMKKKCIEAMKKRKHSFFGLFSFLADTDSNGEIAALQ